MQTCKRSLALILAAVMLLSMSAFASADDAWDRETSILVVGAGAAGLTAAVEAVDQGAESVLVIEKQGLIGGTLAQTEGIISGYETKLAQAQDIHLTAQEAYDQMMATSNYEIDPELTWITAEKCGETIDWLMDTVKVPFNEEVIINYSYGPLPFIHNVVGKGSGFIAPFQAALEERNIEVLTNTRATKLITDEDGTVIGVLASQKDGDIRIKADAVILATGGYGSNADLVSRLDSMHENVFPHASVSSTGDGLIMAGELGATIVNTDIVQVYPFDYDIIKLIDVTTQQATVGGFIFSDSAIMIGQDGQRYMNERNSFSGGRDIGNHLRQMIEDGTDHTWGIMSAAIAEEKGLVRGEGLEFIQAETVEELGAALGIKTEKLQAGIDHWNEICEAGTDTDFGRTSGLVKLEAPFIAVPIGTGSMITYGGLLRDESAAVVKVDGSTIPGLYAAGEVTAAATENGWTLSHAFTWGRIAAQSAVQFAAAK